MQRYRFAELSEKLGVGEVTIKDIVDTLMKPARDPRDAFPQPLLKTDVLKMEDLKVGMELTRYSAKCSGFWSIC